MWPLIFGQGHASKRRPFPSNHNKGPPFGFLGRDLLAIFSFWRHGFCEKKHIWRSESFFPSNDFVGNTSWVPFLGPQVAPNIRKKKHVQPFVSQGGPQKTSCKNGVVGPPKSRVKQPTVTHLQCGLFHPIYNLIYSILTTTNSNTPPKNGWWNQCRKSPEIIGGSPGAPQTASQVSVTLLGSLDHVMAAQGQLEMVLSLAPWLFLMMIGTTLWSGLMKTHWFP